MSPEGLCLCLGGSLCISLTEQPVALRLTVWGPPKLKTHMPDSSSSPNPHTGEFPRLTSGSHSSPNPHTRVSPSLGCLCKEFLLRLGGPGGFKGPNSPKSGQCQPLGGVWTQDELYVTAVGMVSQPSKHTDPGGPSQALPTQGPLPS